MEADILDEIAADGDKPSTDLSEVIALAEKQLEAEAEVDRCEQALKEAKKALQKIEQDQLPAAMKAARMTTFGLETGQVVTVKEEMSISVPKKRKAEIIDKVRKDFEMPELIGNTITIEVDKGKDNVAGEIMAKAAELGLTAERAEDVNSGSLKKVLLDRKKEGKTDDLSFFGAFLVTKAVVK